MQNTCDIHQDQYVDKVVVVVFVVGVVQTPQLEIVEIPQLWIVGKGVESSKIQTVQVAQISNSFPIPSVRQVTSAEIVKVAESGASVIAESVFVTSSVMKDVHAVVGKTAQIRQTQIRDRAVVIENDRDCLTYTVWPNRKRDCCESGCGK